jgi:hypothetical protein
VSRLRNNKKRGTDQCEEEGGAEAASCLRESVWQVFKPFQ